MIRLNPEFIQNPEERKDLLGRELSEIKLKIDDKYAKMLELFNEQKILEMSAEGQQFKKDKSDLQKRITEIRHEIDKVSLEVLELQMRKGDLEELMREE